MYSMKSCSFTGHRNINIAQKDKLPDLLSRAIEYAYKNGCRTFYAGGAIGFDTEAARAVIKYRISHPDVTLILLLPCVDQAEKWSAHQRDMYEYTLREANETEYISDAYFDGCLKIRNQALAERCDILIAYVGRMNSGAAQTVRMAKSLGKEVYNLYPALENK
jgi:uncharacterized phage-like protein YoqJ